MSEDAASSSLPVSGRAAGAASPEAELPDAERLKFFTDAVVAIALTLLVLPLLDSASEALTRHQGTTQILREHTAQLFSFGLSFAVVTAFWIIHHRVFEHVERTTPLLTALSFAWMFSIVFLQFPTALVGSHDADRALLLLYVGPMALCSVLQSAMTLLIAHNPQIRGRHPSSVRSQFVRSLLSTVLFLLILLLVGVLPGLTYYPLLLLFLMWPLQHLLSRQSLRREPKHGN